MRVRIASWNVHACVGADGRYDPERTSAALASLEADVIGLQEVDWRRPRVGGLDQLGLFALRTGMAPVAGPCLRDHAGDYGNGLLSALPIESARTTRWPSGRGEPRGAIDATVALDGVALRVIVTHLGLSRGTRRRQVQGVRELVGVDRREADPRAAGDGADPPAPTVLLGDLNEWLPLRLAARGLVPGTFSLAVGRRSFPSRLPLLCLDYALVKGPPCRARVVPVEARVPRVASDHLPLVVELEW